MSKPLLDLPTKVLDIIKQKQPITATDVAKLLPDVKAKDVNIAIYQKLKGLVVQNGVDASKPLWWTPVGLSEHQIRQMSMEAMLDETDGVMDKKEVERREWVMDCITSNELQRQILDSLRTDGPQSIFEIRGKIKDFSLEDITTKIEELGFLKMVSSRDDGRLILVKDELRRRILGLFSPSTQTHSWHSFRKNGLVDQEIWPILKELEEAKLINRSPGGLFCTLCQTNCPVWSLPRKPEAKSIEQLDHILAVDKKEYQDDLADQIIDVLRNHGAQSAESLEDQLGFCDLDNVNMALEELKSRKLVTQREDKRWIMAQPESPMPEGSLFNRIVETLRNGGAMTPKELEDELEDVSGDDMFDALMTLDRRMLITIRENKHYILAAPKDKVDGGLLTRVIDLFRKHGTLASNELSDKMDDGRDDIAKAVDELVTRGQITECTTGCRQWRIVAPDAAIETKDKIDDGSFEIDRKTLAKGVSDVVDKMEVNQKRWAACMRTSNPVLAQQIMDLLASKPQRAIDLMAEIMDQLASKPRTAMTTDVNVILRELQGLGQVDCTRGFWFIVDNSARIKKIREDIHRLVDELCDLVS